MLYTIKSPLALLQISCKMKTCLVLFVVFIQISLIKSSEFKSHERDSSIFPFKLSLNTGSSYYENPQYQPTSSGTKIEDTEEEKPIYNIQDAPELFEKFKKDFNKHYRDYEDEEKHYHAFVNSLREINNVNSSGKSYSADINFLSDIDEDEFSILNG
ncbi:unnamed protein product [Diatraea saccharalis]|uniref:Cathepsin propeptide inhibitor domain-containing protein n=1 Tax=Diatraea saccharalis TaxID=40085 RepID=A0A9N9WB34_9NEOP|nr:unnamed protein product [Diatraea saccharalis]